MSSSSDSESTAVIVLSVVLTGILLTLQTGGILHWVPFIAALWVGLWVTSVVQR